jgi:hypothetical protein
VPISLFSLQLRAGIAQSWTGWERNKGQDILLSFAAVTSAERLQWLLPGGKLSKASELIIHPPSNAEVKNICSHTSTPPHTFMECWTILPSPVQSCGNSEVTVITESTTYLYLQLWARQLGLVLRAIWRYPSLFLSGHVSQASKPRSSCTAQPSLWLKQDTVHTA